MIGSGEEGLEGLERGRWARWWSFGMGMGIGIEEEDEDTEVKGRLCILSRAMLGKG